jgi:hypothetical protein
MSPSNETATGAATPVAVSKAIETTYRGARFRSRLEARWAAFFDLLGWRWEYEPIDLNGYIPDFILLLHQPVLVEVKPAWTCAELERLAAEKIVSSGWDKEALIVGASWRLCDEPYCGKAVLGANSQSPVCNAEATFPGSLLSVGERFWPAAEWIGCAFCGSERSWYNDVETWCCRLCGGAGKCYLGNGPDLDGLSRLWNEAGSTVRWKAK